MLIINSAEELSFNPHFGFTFPQIFQGMGQWLLYFLLRWGIVLPKFGGIVTELEIFEFQVLDPSLI